MRLIGLENGQKLQVEFDDDHEAIKDNSAYFIWFLGQTVRNQPCRPLQVKEWKNIQNDCIEHMWHIMLVSCITTYLFSH